MMKMMKMMKIEVVYAAGPAPGGQLSSRQQIIVCELPCELPCEFSREFSREFSQGASVREAIEQSGILQAFPEIDLNQNRVGIFSEQVSLDHSLSEGDRVEIYRPLTQDPKEARRIRAKKA